MVQGSDLSSQRSEKEDNKTVCTLIGTGPISEVKRYLERNIRALRLQLAQNEQETQWEPCLRTQDTHMTPLLTKDQGINTETPSERETRNQNQHKNEKYCLNCRDFGHDVFNCKQPGKERAISFLRCQEELFTYYKQAHADEQLQRLEAVETAHKLNSLRYQEELFKHYKYGHTNGQLQKLDAIETAHQMINPSGKYWNRDGNQREVVERDIPVKPISGSSQVGTKFHRQRDPDHNANPLTGSIQGGPSDGQLLTPQTPFSSRECEVSVETPSRVSSQGPENENLTPEQIDKSRINNNNPSNYLNPIDTAQGSAHINRSLTREQTPQQKRCVTFNQTFGQIPSSSGVALNRQEMAREQYPPPQVLNPLEPGYEDHFWVIDPNIWDKTNIPKPILITPWHPRMVRPQPDPEPEYEPKGKNPPIKSKYFSGMVEGENDGYFHGYYFPQEEVPPYNSGQTEKGPPP